MDKRLNRAFEQAIIHLKVSDIILSKEINKDVFASRKYAQIVSSVREIGLIEAPIVTFSDDGYTLLDGHLRLNALKDLGIQEVDCLVSTDNENFTYNKHVKGYVKTLVMNPRVNRYLRINNPDILEHLESIVDIDNLNPEE